MMAVENSSEIKNCAMAEENNTSEVKEIDTNPQEMTMSEEGSVRRIIVKDVGNVEDVALKDQDKCVSKTKEVPKPPSVSSRRHSTGAIGTLAGGKLEVKSRYRGNHHVPSTHDLCKHEGKLGDHRDDAVKPWKVVRRRTSVEGSEVVEVETTSSGLRRTSLGSLSRQIPAVAMRDALAVKKKPCASVNSETSSNKGTESTVSGGGSSVAKNVLGLASEKSSSKVYTPKTKEKAKNQTISGEDVKEKTVCIVEASVKGVQTSSEKKSMRSILKSLATPTKRGSAKKVPELEAKKIRPTKKIGVKVTPAKQLSFKKGKTLEPELLEEQETQSEGRKKNLKGVVGETKSVSCEGSKREKVVLRRRKVEGKKKRMTLFNSVIEETMNKLIKVRKTKVKALTGAFEFVISLQDTNKTPHSKDVTSESKVSPLGSKQ
ncbi:BnaC07g31130D [Brassica napus]|uniref:BnaC07g31130D protein n=1 Tax=Brassica napus TaxID=3708 RepID=A0A078GCN4_BRANA|nr:BnaC07g31130D [Brassica napus]